MLDSTSVSELNENQGWNTHWAKRTTRAGHNECLLLYFVFKLELFLFVSLIFLFFILFLLACLID